MKKISVLSILLCCSFLVQSQSFTKITSGNIVTETKYSYGASWVDYDNDGDLDMFVSNIDSQNDDLYQNNGDGTFTKITSGPIVNDGALSEAASWADYNNDGNIDLFVATASGNNLLYRNDGSGTFTKITTGNIVSDGGTSIGATWGDYDNDGFVDLFVANYGQNNFLYHNNGNGTFTKITSGSIVTDGGSSIGCTWGDYDNDDYLDLFVANAGGQNDFLYHNNGNGTFTKITSGPIVTDGIWSNAASWGDYDNDGDLDLFVTTGYSPPYTSINNLLYRNDGNGSFTKITTGSIVNDGGVSQGSAWGDYDNDGDLDLFVANTRNDGTGTVNFLYENKGNSTFDKITLGNIVTDLGESRASTWGDYDNDGDIDLYVTNELNQANCLYRNDGNANHWINIKCIGTISNKSAIGTKIKIKANNKWQYREISTQTGHNSQNSLNEEFGVGASIIIDSIKIQWPSGLVCYFTNVASDQFLNISEDCALLDSILPDARFTSSEPGCVGHLENFYPVLTGTAITHSWDFGSGATPATSTADSPTDIVYSTPGAKLVTHIITTVLGSDTITNIITVNPVPTASFTSTAPVCQDASINFSNTGSSGLGFTYSWDFGLDAFPSLSAAQSPEGIVYSSSGTKTVTQYITNQFGCTTINTQTISINALPNAVAGKDTTICPNASLMLGTSSTPGYSYSWFPVSSLSSGTVSNPVSSPISPVTLYTLKVTNTNSCVNYDSVVVTMLSPLVANAGIDVSICLGDSIQIGSSLVEGQAYTWLPVLDLSDSTLSNPMAKPSVTTTYSTLVSYANCDIVNDEVTVTVLPLPKADAGLEDTITTGASIELNASGGLQYAWEPALLLNNPGIYNPIASPFLTTTFTVTVTDVNTCINTDTVSIVVIEPGVWAPNAFTPGANGRNDVFYIRGKDIQDFEFAVFNRWGEQIFFSTDMNLGWNGTKQPTGEELPEGAYVYTVKGELSNGEAISMRGMVNLIR